MKSTAIFYSENSNANLGFIVKNVLNEYGLYTIYLKDIDDISICHLSEEDIVRSPLVRKIIQAYEKAEDI